MSTPAFITPALKTLQERTFLPRGFDVRAVGGCVRDHLRGDTPKDIDLCTDATPDEQIAAYEADGVHYFTTGLKHGTLTVKLGKELYEITSLRGETDHDGRHASVYYHRDWIADLGRRDLTINAMAMTLEGAVIDPHGGWEDLEANRVRFVGDPAQRIREDYLRILRFLRFHARYGSGGPLDPAAESAIQVLGAEGLWRISRERVWSEMQRIVVGPYGGLMLRHMMRLGIAKPCSLPHGSWQPLVSIGPGISPVAAMVAFLIDSDAILDLAREWRWSRAERLTGVWLANHLHADIDPYRLIARDGIDPDQVVDLLALRGEFETIEQVRDWTAPAFPLKGADLVAAGHKPGPRIGEMLDSLKSLWADTGYTLDKTALLERAPS